MALTQHRPHSALAGRRYGAFSGKTPGPTSTHPVGKIIQHRPLSALAGKRYGSFAGRGGAPAVLWDFAAPNELALVGVIGVSGDIGFVVPVSFNLSATSAVGFTGTMSVLGDLAYQVTFDLDPTGAVGLAGVLGASGDLAYLQAFNIDAAQPIGMAGTFAMSATFAFSDTPPDLSTPLRTFRLAVDARGHVMSLVYRDGVARYVDTPRGRQRITLLSTPFAGRAMTEFGEILTLL